MKITIYSTTTCSYCHVLRAWLDNQNVAYDYKLTDKDDTAMDDYLRVNEGLIGVPFTVIERDDGSEVKILGFDKAKFTDVLGIS